MIAWLDQLQTLTGQQVHCVLVTVCGTRGSTPRETGAKMIVTDKEVFGTIGGGKLEHQCVRTACEWLRGESQTGRIRREQYTLGVDCGQCCGGVAEILFEEITRDQAWWIDKLDALYQAGTPAAVLTFSRNGTPPGKWLVTADACISEQSCETDSVAHTCDKELREAVTTARRILQSQAPAQRIVVAVGKEKGLPVLIEPVQQPQLQISLFGAGHVGAACVSVLSRLDAHIHWIDSRAEVINDYGAGDRCPANVTPIHADNPALIVERLPPQSFYLVMTHDHALDLEICASVLARPDLVYCGLIGSRAKRRRFIKRLRALALSESQIAKLTCPIGIDTIEGKKPAEIAISVAAQLLELKEALVLSNPVTCVPADLKLISGDALAKRR